MAERGQRSPGTRQRVIEAAIKCILEQGFYRASSNAIAETAGLTWGVIQYHFGTRESLMLAVLEEGNLRLVDMLSRVEITAESMPARLEQYFSSLESYYADPDYLAFIQVLLNLSHDPRTSEQTLASMTNTVPAIEAQLTRITEQLFAGSGIRRQVLRTFPFYVLRGMALSEVMLNTLPFDTSAMQKNVAAQRQLLTEAVSLLLENESTSRSG
ncbi:MAG: TetR/AcrR family transcriptional regulator [Acidimicrobiaceae bacterium]|nr:TetR/AcrR family transcriptional regulator [Acidimicrobiaceae bacterium]